MGVVFGGREAIIGYYGAGWVLAIHFDGCPTRLVHLR
jgi:hypothetical protein